MRKNDPGRSARCASIGVGGLSSTEHDVVLVAIKSKDAAGVMGACPTYPRRDENVLKS